MSKIFVRIICLLALIQICVAQSNKRILHKENAIDSIKTSKQLRELITRVDSRYKDFHVNDSLKFDNRNLLKNYKKIADSLQVQPWSKADFDSNGLTDILVIGVLPNHYILCILDKGNNQYEIKAITRKNFHEYTFPIVRNNKIVYYFESYQDRNNWNKPRKLESVILKYQFGDFIEENQKPTSLNIGKIEYATSACYGSCPIFKLTINSNRTSNLFAEEYNKIDKGELQGSFQTTITKAKFKELTTLLNYIDFVKLDDKYAVNWTDDQSSTLKITYNNGKVKSIHDYGLIGTFGLNRVYQLLFELRENQKWTEIIK